ncbi:MAG: efflux RND transporter periplasmic adaptor subunit [Planctomycetaceae bacterium]|nr:efflux RND transporter periplasmic adaptor subunit [Planctomycetaceae bacterium]
MKYLLTPVVLAVSIGAGWLVYRDSLAKVEAKPAPVRKEPVAVRVVGVSNRTIEDQVELVGQIAPAGEFQVRARISGYIRRLPAPPVVGSPGQNGAVPPAGSEPATVGQVASRGGSGADETGEENVAAEAAGAAAPLNRRSPEEDFVRQLDVGDYVQRGQLIVELESSSFREAVARAEAAWQVTQAQLRAKLAELDQAQKELDRQVRLGRSGVVTTQQREEAEATVAIATAQVELERANVSQADSDRTQARIALEETKILAGQSGHVAERFVGVGDLANPADPLLRIVNIETVQTVVRVAERDYPRVQVGQEASISVDAWPGRTFRGTVVRKSPVLDPETRTGELQVEIPNPDATLRPGMHARVFIVLERRTDVPVVPLAALMGQAEAPELFVVRGTPAKTWQVSITTGISDGEVIEVLSGLEPGDRVVTLGNRIVSDGQEVTVVDATAPAEVQPVAAEPESDGTQTGG